MVVVVVFVVLTLVAVRVAAASCGGLGLGPRCTGTAGLAACCPVQKVRNRHFLGKRARKEVSESKLAEALCRWPGRKNYVSADNNS